MALSGWYLNQETRGLGANQHKDILQLDVLGREAKKAHEAGSLSTNQSSTTIIVRVPCLAIRYPLVGRQVEITQNTLPIVCLC